MVLRRPMGRGKPADWIMCIHCLRVVELAGAFPAETTLGSDIPEAAPNELINEIVIR